MQYYIQAKLRSCIGLLLLVLMSAVVPQPVLAAPTLDLINNRPETVRVALNTWDADRNTRHFRGWFAVKPNSTTTITIEHYPSYSEVVWLYASSKTRVWEGVSDPETKEFLTKDLINTNRDFQYWGDSGKYRGKAGWQEVYFFHIGKNEDGNFTYTFD